LKKIAAIRDSKQKRLAFSMKAEDDLKIENSGEANIGLGKEIITLLPGKAAKHKQDPESDELDLEVVIC
jgi:hypothetical protein